MFTKWNALEIKRHKKRSAVPGVCERRQFTGCNWSHISAPQAPLRTRQSAGEKQNPQYLITVFDWDTFPTCLSFCLCCFFFFSYNAVIKTTFVCPLAWEQAGRNSTEYLSELSPLSLIGLSWPRNRVMLVMNRVPPGPGLLFTTGLFHSSTIIPWVPHK